MEWHRLGGVLVLMATPCADFSLSLVRLMMFLICSFWLRLCSLLLHHIGLLYSHWRPRCLQARQADFPSSHFFRRKRHVKHPAELPLAKCPSAGSLRACQRGQGVPVRDRRCIFAAACFAALAALLVPAMVEDCLVVGVGVEEEDMEAGCTSDQQWYIKNPINNAAITTNARRDDSQGTGWQGSTGLLVIKEWVFKARPAGLM